MKSVRSVLLGLAVLLAAGARADDKPATPWPTPVPGHVPVQPGEHPRLLFRKTDLPAIKARAQTPEGKKIVERLKATLGGGEAMPTVYNKAKRAYDKNSLAPEGAFTISHMAGFGMLYQLTGDRKYAELGRQCFLKGKEGIRDRDNRYSQTHVDGQLRLGPSLAMLALGYDLCYDGWDEAFRQEVAQFIQNYSMESRSARDGPKPPVLSFKGLVYDTRHGPVSNHQGAAVGGAGFAALGLLGDPGTDKELLADLDAKCRERLVNSVPEGFGSFAFFAEGQGPSHVGVNSGLVPYVQALRVAAGQDYVTGSSMVQWWTLRWVMEMLGDGHGHALYPARHELMGASYGKERLLVGNGGMTHGGWFSQGFGTIPDKYKPALLWTYDTFAAAEDNNEFDTRNYPHRAIMALVNWPLGMKAENPAGVMPKAICDSLHSYYVIRNRWQDSDDVVITLFGKTGNYRQQKAWGARPTKIFGVGEQVALSAVTGRHDHMETAADGSTSLRWPGKAPKLFAVDFSRRGGVDAVIVHNLGMEQDANSHRTLQRRVSIGKSALNCLTLSTTDQHPAISQGTIGDKPAAIIGGLAVTLEDDKLVFHDAPGTPAAMVDAKTLKKLFVPPAVDEKDVKLPTDPSYALDFDSRYERDDDLFARNVAAGRRVNGKGDAVLRGVTIVPGVIGEGIRAAGGVAMVPSEATETSLAGDKGFTISYWLYLDEPAQSSSFQFRCEDWYVGYTKGAFRGEFNEKKFDVDTDIETERWHHVAWVGDPAEKRWAFWYDGQFRGSMASSGKAGGGGTFGIGMYIKDEDVPSPGYPWSGRLDEVRLYRRPLTTGEVTALYREGMKAVADREADGNQAPSASFDATPVRGLPPLTVAFDGSGSSDPDDGKLTYAWDFGDGAKSTDAAPSHTYTKFGRYAAKLTVTDEGGSAVTVEKAIVVENQPPRIEVRAGWDTEAGKGEKPYGADEIKLDASASVDPEGKPLKLEWTVAGKKYEGSVVRATLPAPGAYPVTLVADDGTGRTTTWRSTVNRPDADGRSLAEKPVGTYTPGLHYRYFHQGKRGNDLSLEKHAVSPIEWNVFKHYGMAHEPLPWNARLRPVHYWIDWAGYLDVPADGEYTFHFNVKGGAYLWLGSRLIGNWYQGFQAKRENEFKDFSVKLQKGKHRFRLVYMTNKYHNQNLALTWSGPGFENAFIPTSAFTRSLTVAEQQAAGIASPQPGSDVWDWFPESNPPLEGKEKLPPATKGKLELTIDGPATDRFVTARVKLPADFVEPVEVIFHPGDGSRVLAREFSRLYPPGADYTVTVEATDTEGRSATAFRTISVPATPAVESIGLMIAGSSEFLRPTTVAGVFPQRFWNTLSKGVVGEKIRDSVGREVALQVNAIDQSQHQPPAYKGRTSPMEDQMLGMAGWFNTKEIVLAGIPYDRYDLVLLAPGGKDDTGLLEMAVAVGDQTRTVKTTRETSDFDGRYIEEADSNPAGNYVVFRGLTGPNQKISLQSVKGAKRPAINAIQIIRVK